jgi:hypothetical protein
MLCNIRTDVQKSVVIRWGYVHEKHRGWQDKGVMENWGLGEEWPLLTLLKA